MSLVLIGLVLLGIYLLWIGKISLAVALIGTVVGYLLWASGMNRYQAHKMFLTGVRFARDNPGAEFPYDALGADPLAISAVNLGMLASADPDPESLYYYDQIYAAAKSLHGVMSSDTFR